MIPRPCPSNRQARRSLYPYSCCARSAEQGRRSGLRSFPAPRCAEPASPGKVQLPAASTSCSPSPTPSSAAPGRASARHVSVRAKRNRGWNESNPGFGLLASHLGNTPKALIPASGSKKRRVCQKYARFLRRAPNEFRTRHLRLDVVVQRELVRMGPRIDSLDLVLHLVADPCFDQVFAENVSLEQEVVVLLQGDEGFFK